MKAISLLGVVLFMITSLVVGTRVLVRGLRARKLPELLLAAALLMVGFLCYAVGSAGKLVVNPTIAMRGSLTLAGLTLEGVGQLSLIAFAWRVFQPRQLWAALVAALLGTFIFAALAGETLSGQYLRYSDAEPMRGPWIVLGLTARGLAPAWMSFECFRLHRQLRRRLAVGLADPLVVNRVWLWGFGIGASALGYLTSIVHRLIFGTGLREHTWAISTVSALALVAAVCIWLAFFPPERYRRRLRNA